MKTATILSVCECQARLGAELDENRQVVSGWAKDRRRRLTREAPAHSIHPDHDVFQVAWFCPFFIRNTTRSFQSTGLSFKEPPEPTPAPAAEPVAAS